MTWVQRLLHLGQCHCLNINIILSNLFIWAKVTVGSFFKHLVSSGESSHWPYTRFDKDHWMIHLVFFKSYYNKPEYTIYLWQVTQTQTRIHHQCFLVKGSHSRIHHISLTSSWHIISYTIHLYKVTDTL